MDETTYKEPFYVLVWLETALKKEWQKYAAMPVTRDMVPGHNIAQAWGYVVAGYFLIEQGLKAVLYMRNGKPPKIHALSVLFGKLPAEDQGTLRTYYDDFRHTFPGMSSFPLVTLDDFLVNLDGEQNSQDRYIGSFDWRYFLTEEGRDASMPFVSINVMHEVVYGCVQLVKSIYRSDERVAGAIYSRRLRQKRLGIHRSWLRVRMNSPGWGQEGDRIEILWGPDYGDRYDYLVFKGDTRRPFFGPLPKAEEVEVPMIDKRSELELFDLVEWQEPGSHHIMY